MSELPAGRAARRLVTRERILAAARGCFASRGYDGTTVRAIAAAAETDPSLVIRHFGSKAALFRAVADSTMAVPVPGGDDDVLAGVLAGLAAKLEERPEALLAGLRGILAGAPEAADALVQRARAEQDALAAALPGDNPGVAAGLIGAVVFGAVLARHVLPIAEVQGASTQQLMELLEPCLRLFASQDQRAGANGGRREQRRRSPA